MYFRLLQDYPRAAFWLRRAGVKKGDPDAVMLAECYWRMGSRHMALAELMSPRLPLSAIKLYGDLGETRRAVQLARAFAQLFGAILEFARVEVLGHLGFDLAADRSGHRFDDFGHHGPGRAG